MNVRRLAIQGYKSAVDNMFLEQASDHLAILFPGRGYTNLGACLRFPSLLLQSRGAAVVHVDYTYQRAEGFAETSEKEQAVWILADVQAAVNVALAQREYKRITLIGKSLGTYALSLLLPNDARLRDADVIWLTPVFKYAAFSENLKACQQASLFVIGTADSHYDPEQLEGKQSYVIEDADHGLEIPAKPVTSVAVLHGLLERIDTFIYPKE